MSLLIKKSCSAAQNPLCMLFKLLKDNPVTTLERDGQIMLANSQKPPSQNEKNKKQNHLVSFELALIQSAVLHLHKHSIHFITVSV